MVSFRKRISIAPGFKLNLSKSGVGLTAGVKGASLSFGQKGVFLNNSIPGTGLYRRKKLNFGGSEKSIDENSVLSKLTKAEMVESLENLIDGIRDVNLDKSTYPYIFSLMDVNVNRLTKAEILDHYLAIKEEGARILEAETQMENQNKTYPMPPLPKKNKLGRGCLIALKKKTNKIKQVI